MFLFKFLFPLKPYIITYIILDRKSIDIMVGEDKNGTSEATRRPDQLESK